MAKLSKINSGDLIEITTANKIFIGLFVPCPNSKILLLKLQNGYNLGIDKKEIKKVKLIKTHEKKITAKKRIAKRIDLPAIALLHTGGTIASRVDYITGGVFSKFEPDDLLEFYPELQELADIKNYIVFQMLSEDMEPKHWSVLAEKIAKISSKVKGVIVTHGTDTMAYTAAALSFMLKNINIPVLLVGAQRSPDRGSSDAPLNLLSAVNFILNAKFKGVALCMHGSTSDEYCLVHNGVNVKKMDTSRRNTFRSINALPIAKIWYDGKIEVLHELKKALGEFSLKNKFEKRIAIVKIRPGFDYKELNAYKNYKGLVIEGTGMGHAPINVVDKYTRHHNQLLKALEKMAKKMVIAMTSQCPYGNVHMDVYSTGITLQKIGIIPTKMLAEVAYVKLGWLLGNFKDVNKVKQLMQENLCGEIVERILPETFLQ